MDTPLSTFVIPREDIQILISIVTLIISIIVGYVLGKTSRKKIWITIILILVFIPVSLYVYSLLSSKNTDSQENVKGKNETEKERSEQENLKKNKEEQDRKEIEEQRRKEKEEKEREKSLKKNYELVEKDTYKISFNDRFLGYIKLPPTAEIFTVFSQHPTKRGEGSCDFLDNRIDKNMLLRKLGEYITETQTQTTRLILGMSDGKIRSNGKEDWALGSMVKYGKDLSNLKYPKMSYEWHPSERKAYDVQGWLDFENN